MIEVCVCGGGGGGGELHKCPEWDIDFIRDPTAMVNATNSRIMNYKETLTPRPRMWA